MLEHFTANRGTSSSSLFSLASFGLVVFASLPICVHIQDAWYAYLMQIVHIFTFRAVRFSTNTKLSLYHRISFTYINNVARGTFSELGSCWPGQTCPCVPFDAIKSLQSIIHANKWANNSLLNGALVGLFFQKLPQTDVWWPESTSFSCIFMIFCNNSR